MPISMCSKPRAREARPCHCGEFDNTFDPFDPFDGLRAGRLRAGRLRAGKLRPGVAISIQHAATSRFGWR
ncbi:MAG: hypothetical protein J4N79_11645 [Chloroflexi bacterium]|nr:hypothetical protein [Chloroflexota bacterium]